MERHDLNILLVEDSAFFGRVVSERLQQDYGFRVAWAKTLAEAMAVLDESADFFAAVLDYNLPDAPQGEVVAKVVKRGIPAIVFTATLNEELRKAVWINKVVDYVLKEGIGSVEYVAEAIRRLQRNREIPVLVVDDSVAFRHLISSLLQVHGYQVHTASNGREALTLIGREPGIQLVVTDYNMPEMDGVALVSALRQQFGRDQLAIIGMSGQGEGVMAARFMKSGANDFIVKQNLLPEEFYCRVNQNLDYLAHVHHIREAAIRDPLTGLHNRRYFFEAGPQLYANAKRDLVYLSCAMLDIDFFKKVNDQYGHEAGDRVLVAVAEAIRGRLRKTDLLARMGGEEFCLLVPSREPGMADGVFEDIRRRVEALQVTTQDGQSLRVTLSIGGTSSLGGTLEEMLGQADALLYQAKQSGRNRVVSDT
ncbi:MAG: diguanylate cyclase [Desulfuromonadaceae bacterium]|nr:diguanylate cyclase [Desulfuromonadaceae bacterium]